MVYRTRGTCSQEIRFQIEGRAVRGVSFYGGCRGNLEGISRLVEGQDIDDVIASLKGIQCRGGTSCPDQLARALESYKEENGL